MYPDLLSRDLSPGLETFYVIATLLVVFLAIVSVWSPFIHLIRELNTIIARTILFLHRELLGCKYSCFLVRLEDFFVSPITLSTMALALILFALYLASTDILGFAKFCICKIRTNKYWRKLKEKMGWQYDNDVAETERNPKLKGQRGKGKGSASY